MPDLCQHLSLIWGSLSKPVITKLIKLRLPSFKTEAEDVDEAGKKECSSCLFSNFRGNLLGFSRGRLGIIVIPNWILRPLLFYLQDSTIHIHPYWSIYMMLIRTVRVSRIMLVLDSVIYSFPVCSFTKGDLGSYPVHFLLTCSILF